MSFKTLQYVYNKLSFFFQNFQNLYGFEIEQKTGNWNNLHISLNEEVTMERRQRGVSAGLLLLLYQISQVGLQNIPSVTLGVLVLNIFLFLNPLRPLSEVCLSVNEAVHRKNWQRLLLAPFHHADDWHLYYNMISMLWKGIMLERKLKSIWFAYIIAVFSVLIGVVYMVLEVLLVIILDDPSYERNCGVGFSGKTQGWSNLLM